MNTDPKIAAGMIALSERRSTHALDQCCLQGFQYRLCRYWLQENLHRRTTLVHLDKLFDNQQYLWYDIDRSQLEEYVNYTPLHKSYVCGINRLEGGPPIDPPLNAPNSPWKWSSQWQLFNLLQVQQAIPRQIKVRLDGVVPLFRGIGSEKLEDVANGGVYPEEGQRVCLQHPDGPVVVEKGRRGCLLRMPWVLQVAFLLICCVGSARSFNNHHPLLLFPNMEHPFVRHSTTASRRYDTVTQHSNVAGRTFAARSKEVEVLDVEPTTRESKLKETKYHGDNEQPTVKIKGQRNKGKNSKEKKIATTEPIKAPDKINKLSTKKTCKSTTKIKAKTIPKKWHWKDNDDDNTYSNAIEIAEEQIRLVHFTVHGNPLPLRRHRTARGFMYNPSFEHQASFRNVTTEILGSVAPPQLFQNNTNTKSNGTSSSSLLSLPLYSKEQPLVMSILFRMKRPNHHFIGNKPGPGRLRDTAPLETALTRSDVDNLAKFVLDSMNGLIYADDHQVCSLHITKLMDNRGNCRGSTQICIRPLLGEQDVPVILANSFLLNHNNIVLSGHESK